VKIAKRVALGFIAFVVLIVIIAVVTSKGNNTADSSATVTASAMPASVIDPSGMACAALGANGYCPAPTASTEPTPAAVTTSAAAAPSTPAAPVTIAASSALAMTNGQYQAVTAAQDYLSDGQGFSYHGLLQQLTSNYGSGFSASDAEFAINYLSPDWDAQAVISAKGYLSDGEGFSRSSLIQQLTSDYGSGFTEAQAEYAADKVGL
jgi:hypothetical protein